MHYDLSLDSRIWGYIDAGAARYVVKLELLATPTDGARDLVASFDYPHYGDLRDALKFGPQWADEIRDGTARGERMFVRLQAAWPKVAEFVVHELKTRTRSRRIA